MKNKERIHVPVLLQEILTYLQIKSEGNYVDCTLGDGGYSEEIVKKLGSGSLVSIDCDEQSVKFVEDNIKPKYSGKHWTIVHDNFSNLEKIVAEYMAKGPDGIVFDLGLSSRQLDRDEKKRGFSYSSDQRMDMRMDTRYGVTAEDLIRAASESELSHIFAEYGEEQYANRIVKALKKYVRENPDKTVSSDAVAALVRKVVPAVYREGSKHPARRVFQALRIAVNNELQNLQQGLASALSIVSSGGRVCVVSFHSLEDRIVKEIFLESMSSGNYEIITKKPITPSSAEVKSNSRATSAKLRVIEKK